MAVFTGNGSAASPSLTFSSDTDTGIFRPDADQLALVTNGVERVFVNNTGDVGLGTTAPNTKLEVNGNIHVSGTNRSIFNRTDSSLIFGANNTEWMRIQGNGLVGIGTPTPDQTLTVSGSMRLPNTQVVRVSSKAVVALADRFRNYYFPIPAKGVTNQQICDFSLPVDDTRFTFWLEVEVFLSANGSAQMGDSRYAKALFGVVRQGGTNPQNTQITSISNVENVASCGGSLNVQPVNLTLTTISGGSTEEQQVRLAGDFICSTVSDGIDGMINLRLMYISRATPEPNFA